MPLRSPGEGKSRLAGTLSVEGRAALAGAMLADVVAALTSSSVDRIVIAASGPAAVAAGSALGLETVSDPTGVRGLDAALGAAASRLGTVGTLLVVAADLPRLQRGDVEAVLGTDAAVVVAPTIDGGTGGLLRRPGHIIATAYGPGSARRHLSTARDAGLRAERRDAPGFAYDVDVAADLVALRDVGGPPLGARTAALLEQLDVADAG
ncbi:MAG: 2-phospho-L-lactate guanylyltransferase [Nitriliruptor sp.]